ncbi:MAG: hypothetical protein AAF570_16495, partial [Bacteroidota bacterium]
LKGDTEEAFHAYEACLQICRDEPYLFEENFTILQVVYTNYLFSCLIDRRNDAFLETLEALRQIPVRHPDDQLSMEINLTQQELLFSMNTADFARGQKLVPRLSELIRKRQLPAGRYLGFYFNLAILHFLDGRYSDANKWMRELLYEPRAESRRDLQFVVWIMQLPVHYELGNQLLLKDLIRAGKRRHKTIGVAQEYFSKVFDFFGKLERSPYHVADFEPAQPFYDDLVTMLEDPNTRNPPGIMELRCWLQSHLEKRPISAIFTEHANAASEK